MNWASSNANPDLSLRLDTPGIARSPSSVSATPMSPTESATSLANPQPKPHPHFWLYDGSIVLSVHNTLFRVHQTILANHSEVFAGLFTVPQPESGGDMIDGCHVVQMFGDDPKDFEDLLMAIYHPEHFDSLSPDADLDALLTFIEGVLRLSTKYMIRHLRQRCISLLLTKLPATFDAYEVKTHTQHPSSSASTLTTAPSTSSPSHPSSPEPPIHHERYRSDTVMRAIKIATEMNVQEALPYAYYCVSRFPHKRLLKDRPGDISWQLKTTILVGRERLSWAQISMSHSFLIVFSRSPLCQNVLCAHARGPHAEWHLLEHSRSPHPLREWEGWERLNVCLECVRYCKERHLIGRKEVWKALPTLFEMPTWDVLREIQNA